MREDAEQRAPGEGLLRATAADRWADPPSPPRYDGTSEELFGLADSLAAAVRGPVVVEDLHQRVLAYSSLPGQVTDEVRRRSILERRVPDLATKRRQYHQVLSSTGVERPPMASPGELPRVAVTIRDRGRPLGTVWAIEGGAPIGREEECGFLDGAQIAARHLLRTRHAVEAGSRIRDDALHAVLDGGEVTAEARLHLGLERRRRLALAAFALTGVAPGGPSSVTPLGAAAARHWAAVNSASATATIGGTVYVLVTDQSAPALRRLAEGASTHLRRTLDVNLRTALSSVVEDPAALPALRIEVDDILRAGSWDPALPAIADPGQARTRVLLMYLADTLARHPHLEHPGVQEMIEHDRAHRTDYAASVAAWLGAAGNFGQAARRLAIHSNTLKYRLRRTRLLFGLDFDDPDDRLLCWLHLRLGRTNAPAP